MSYKFRSPPKRSFVRRNAVPIVLMALGASASSFGFLWPAASGTDSPARLFSEGLSIKLDRSSPAYAALEDAWMGSAPAMPSTEETIAASLPTIRNVAIELSAGSYAPLAEKMVRENHREASLLAQERASREAMSKFLAQAATQALKAMASHFETAPQATNAAVASSNPLPPSTGPTTTKTISLSDLKMSREELVGSLIFPIAQSAMNDRARPSGTIVAGRGIIPPVGGFQWRKPAERVGGLGSAGVPVAPKVISGGKVQAQSLESLADAGEKQPPVRQALISGPIEFADGLALSNTMDRVIVYRDVDGEPQESGQVWLREARYEIFAEENNGQLIGELRTPYGDVIGRGSLEISHLPLAGGNQRRIDNASLRIRPVNQGVSGRVMAMLSSDQRPSVKGAEVNFRDLPFNQIARKDGLYQEPNLLEGSSAIMRAFRPGFWGTVAFAHSGQENDIELFPDREGQMIHQLVKLSRETKTDSSAIIWGRVTKSGKPISGAHAELMTSTKEIRAVYFDAAMAPDLKLQATSANGLYAFFPVIPGTHAVQAVFENGYTTEPQIFPTEERTVSRVDLEAKPERRAKVKIFDAFRTDYPVSAEVLSPGVEHGTIIDRSGVGELRYASGRNLLIMDADGGNAYEKIRVSMSRDRRVIYLPMVQAAWLEGLRGSLKLNKEPQTGTVVGFVQGTSAYKIALEEKSVSQGSRVLYFNDRGEVSGQEHGEPGGGFVIFNIPEGFRTITVQPSGSQKIYSTVALVEAKVTNVISHWIR